MLRNTLGREAAPPYPASVSCRRRRLRARSLYGCYPVWPQASGEWTYRATHRSVAEETKPEETQRVRAIRIFEQLLQGDDGWPLHGQWQRNDVWLSRLKSTAGRRRRSHGFITNFLPFVSDFGVDNMDSSKAFALRLALGEDYCFVASLWRVIYSAVQNYYIKKNNHGRSPTGRFLASQVWYSFGRCLRRFLTSTYQ